MIIETKFSIGHTVFYMANNKVREEKIKNIEVTVYETSKEIYYKMQSSNETKSEKLVYATKAELLKTL